MTQVSLADRDVWVIDDDIPISRWELADDDLLTGTRPIDRGTLLTLVHFRDWWEDDPLRTLCGQLVREAGCVTAFTHPSSAIQHLNRGALIPDVVVFDLDYRINPVGARNALELLEQVLARCVSVVQVYTKTDIEEARRRLEPLLSKYRTRLEDPRYKAETDADQLMEVMKDRLGRSLSAHLARRIRRSSSAAVEDVLTRIDDLPLDVAIRLLAGTSEMPEELELVELLSVKVGEALESAQELAAIVEGFVTDKGVPAERVKEAVCEIVALLSSNVREHILYDRDLFAEIVSAWETTEQGGGTGNGTETQRIVQRFFAFRLYDQPKDDLVRTGDIVTLSPQDEDAQDPPDLYLVTTPPCDLARFWRSTRGRLTLVRMYPLTPERGLARTQGYGNRGFQVGGSITARHPMVIPSVPVGNDKHIDYALFAYETQFEEFENNDLANAGSGNKGFKRPLAYAELEGRVERKCRVSEPFLAGILAELSSILFRCGIPDYPDEEKMRLVELFKNG